MNTKAWESFFNYRETHIGLDRHKTNTERLGDRLGPDRQITADNREG